jgi:hypothetical protein
MGMSDTEESNVPDPYGEDFISFLHYLADVEVLSTDEIIYAVEKPWKYAKEYARFQEGDEA